VLVFGGFATLLVLAVWLWALFDCISTDASLCRNLPKGMWLILVLFLPLIGSIAWMILGRPERARLHPDNKTYAGPAPHGIEDHPRHSGSSGVSDRRSAELDEQLAQWEREEAEKRALEARERDIAARERLPDDG